MSGVHQFSTFSLDGNLFGIEVVKVQEVLRYQRMTPVPLAPPDVAGLINLRGQIVTALELRHRLGLPPRPDHRLPMNVVVRTPEGSLALLVDEIGDVIEVAEESFERPPATLTGKARLLVRGAYKLDSRLLLVLDTERAVGVDEAVGA
jgi:purine-binding chemotaxis protein CheW